MNTFSISESTIPWLLVAARFAHWSTCILLLGTLFFQRLILKPACKTSDINPPVLYQAIWWVILGSYAGALVSGLVWFWDIAAEMGGTTLGATLDPHVGGIVWNQTQVGTITHWRVLFAGAMAANLGLLAWKPNGYRGLSETAIVLAGLLVGSLAWTGHGLMGRGWEQCGHLIADVLHISVAAVWPGALVPLLMTLWLIPPGRVGLILAKNIVRRFSISSMIAVGLLLLTGLVNSLFLVSSITNLATTPYGQFLCVKVGLFGIMVLCGAVNLLWLSPRLLMNGTVRTLCYVVTGEILFAGLILAVVSVLGVIEPALLPAGAGR